MKLKTETKRGSCISGEQWRFYMIKMSSAAVMNDDLILFLLTKKHVITVVKSLRKHAYSNLLKIIPPKNEHFQIKNLIFFIFLLKI